MRLTAQSLWKGREHELQVMEWRSLSHGTKDTSPHPSDRLLDSLATFRTDFNSMRLVQHLVNYLRTRRWSHLFIANLRILLGFAFLPAGLKKVLYQSFTDPENTGTFHEFLHAFYATGFFYQFVGGVQLLIAVLLMTQTFATLGALMALPVITCIMVFCWSTGVIPTAIVTTFMLCATVTLLLWDLDRWLPILRPSASTGAVAAPPKTDSSLIDLSLWRMCGAGILAIYGLTCLLYGGVYRPKGADFGEPAFYVLPLVALFPVVALVVEERRRRMAQS